MSKNPEKKAESIVREEQEAGPSRPDPREGRLARDEDQVDHAKDMIGEFVQQVMQGRGRRVSKDPEAMINARIAADRPAALGAAQRDHAPRRTSRSSKAPGGACTTSCTQTETGTMLKIRVLNVSKKDLLKDLERAAEFDQTALFKKVYEEEYGTFGGAPVRRAGRRLRVRQPPAGHGAAREDLQRRGRGARAVHLRGLARAVRLGQLHRAGRGRATWPRSSRPDRVRQVAVVPRVGGLALRRPHACRTS